MLRRREMTADWMSQQVYRMVPMSAELHRIAEVFPEETILKTVRPYDDSDQGRPSEAPILLPTILFLSFYDSMIQFLR